MPYSEVFLNASENRIKSPKMLDYLSFYIIRLSVFLIRVTFNNAKSCLDVIIFIHVYLQTGIISNEGIFFIYTR